MRRWKPQSSIAPWIALVLLLAAAGAALAIALRLRSQLAGPPETWPVDLRLYAEVLLFLGLIILAGALTYRFAAALTLHYELDRNGLYIVWLGNRAVIPLDRIQSVDLGAAVARTPLGPLQRIGYVWGRSWLADGKVLHRFSTRLPEHSLVIHLPDAAYAIAPSDTEAFVQDLEQRRNLGATMPLQSTVQASRIFLYDFWNDGTVRLMLLVAFAINLAVLALLAARYPHLSAEVWMRFNATGQAAEPRPRHQVLFLPLAAFGLSLLNTALGLVLYRNQQVGARLLQGASIVVQILFGIAVLTIIT